MHTPDSKGSGEVIPPVKVPRKNIRPDDGRIRSSRRLLTFLVLGLSLVLLLVGGGLLLRYLKKNPVYIAGSLDKSPLLESEKEASRVSEPLNENVPETVEKVNPSQSAHDLALSKEAAEQTLSDFLRTKKVLESKGAAVWGGDLYATMISLSLEADAFFMDKEYASASEKYEEALAKGAELTGQSEQALNRLLMDGAGALEEGNGELAQQKFSVALMIDPANETARRSLERAEKLDKVMELIATGNEHEQKKNLSFAYADYQEALQLDPESHEAQRALNRIKEKITEEEFKKLMSSGLAAYYRKDYELARTTLLKARAFKPESHAVQDALSQIDQAIRVARIETLHQQALQAEASEDWKTALQTYAETLGIDNTIQFAIQGRERCLLQLRIWKQIHAYLDKTHLLESDRHLEDATRLLSEASDVAPKGPKLAALVQRLDGLVKTAQTPVRINVVSDNLTDVAIYRVGTFGRFEALELRLRPGSYTVVGKRPGYKDIRQVIVVKAGEEAVQVTVKCRETI